MSLRIDGGDTFIPQNGNGNGKNGNGAKVNKGTDFSLSNALKGNGGTNSETDYLNSHKGVTVEDFVKMGLPKKEAEKIVVEAGAFAEAEASVVNDMTGEILQVSDYQ